MCIMGAQVANLTLYFVYKRHNTYFLFHGLTYDTCCWYFATKANAQLGSLATFTLLTIHPALPPLPPPDFFNGTNCRAPRRLCLTLWCNANRYSDLAEVSKQERGLETTETEANILEWGREFSAPHPLGQLLRLQHDVNRVWTTCFSSVPLLFKARKAIQPNFPLAHRIIRL